MSRSRNLLVTIEYELTFSFIKVREPAKVQELSIDIYISLYGNLFRLSHDKGAGSGDGCETIHFITVLRLLPLRAKCIYASTTAQAGYHCVQKTTMFRVFDEESCLFLSLQGAARVTAGEP